MNRRQWLTRIRSRPPPRSVVRVHLEPRARPARRRQARSRSPTSRPSSPPRPASGSSSSRCDQRAGPLRPRLRHLHPARPRRRDGRRQVPQAVPDRQGPAADRGHLAVVLRQLVLAQRAGARQRASAASTWPCGTSSASGPGMPVYQLLGGKCRKAVDTYRHACGQHVRGGREGGPGADGAGAIGTSACRSRCRGCRPTAPAAQGRQGRTAPANARPQVWEPRAVRPHRCRSCSSTCASSSATRSSCCTTSTSASRRSWRCSCARTWSRTGSSSSKTRSARRTSATSRSCGSRRARRSRWASCSTTRTSGVPLISNRLIDFIRIHISQIGGLTMARKVAALCEFFAVRTAWHGPGDVSPVGHAANVHLDLATPNFGIQEARVFTQAEQDVFPGCPELKDGYLLGQRQAGPGHRPGREAGGEVPDHRRPAVRLALGQRAAARTGRS